MLKTPKQVQEEIKKMLEETKSKWAAHLKVEKIDNILDLRQKTDSEIPKKVEEVLVWIDEALARNEIEGWKELYEKWNGDPDISRDKYNGEKDLVGRLSDLRFYLEEWERASREQSQQEQLKKSQKVVELLRDKIIKEQGKTSWKELETKVEVLENEKI